MNTEPNFTMPLADAALLKLFSGVTASSTTSAFALLQLLWWFGDPQLSLSSGVAACSSALVPTFCPSFGRSPLTPACMNCVLETAHLQRSYL